MFTTNSNNSSSDFARYIGVAALHVIAVNPDKATLNQYGFNTTEEPEYVKMMGDTKYGNVRLLCAIDDLPGKPVVSLYFRAFAELQSNGDNTKFKIIDKYGNTSWATREEIKEKKIPVYKNGNQAIIDADYKPCHRGEEELIRFIKTYIKVSPYRYKDKNTGEYVISKNPGECAFEHWKWLAEGNGKELEEALNLKPDGLIRVILGVRTTDDNKTYQTFIPADFLSYGSAPVQKDGKRIFTYAQRIIDNWQKDGRNGNETYSAEPVKEYATKPTVVEEFEEHTPFDDPDNFPF